MIGVGRDVEIDAQMLCWFRLASEHHHFRRRSSKPLYLFRRWFPQVFPLGSLLTLRE
jgi:hypothetical protein